MAPSVHFATVTIRAPPSNSPTTHVHSPDPNAMGWDEIWMGVPPVLSTNAFMASMWSWMPCVGGCPCTSTTTSSVWWRANTPSQSALFHPVKSRSSMFLRLRVSASSAICDLLLVGELASSQYAARTASGSVSVDQLVPAETARPKPLGERSAALGL